MVFVETAGKIGKALPDCNILFILYQEYRHKSSERAFEGEEKIRMGFSA